MAWLHAGIIKDGKRINHLAWGAAYLVFVIVFSSIISWWLFPCLLLIRKISFDLSLNLMRGLPLFYVSAKPESVIDRFHNSIFGARSEVYMAIYFLILIAINVFILKGK